MWFFTVLQKKRTRNKITLKRLKNLLSDQVCYYCYLYILYIFVDIDDCNPNQCQNGATCIDEVNKYSCFCQEGYTGYNCKIGKTRHFSDKLCFILNLI